MLNSDFRKASLIRSCSEDKLPRRAFGEPFEGPRISPHSLANGGATGLGHKSQSLVTNHIPREITVHPWKIYSHCILASLVHDH